MNREIDVVGIAIVSVLLWICLRGLAEVLVDPCSDYHKILIYTIIGFSAIIAFYIFEVRRNQENED